MPSELLRLGPLVAIASLGCATIIHGSTQKVEITSNPPGASVLVLPDQKKLVTPGTVELERKRVHTVLFELDGCRPATGYLDRLNSNATIGNAVLGGLIGMAIDYDSGAVYRLDPDPLHVELDPEETPLQSSDSSPTAPRCQRVDATASD